MAIKQHQKGEDFSSITSSVYCLRLNFNFKRNFLFQINCTYNPSNWKFRACSDWIYRVGKMLIPISDLSSQIYFRHIKSSVTFFARQNFKFSCKSLRLMILNLADQFYFVYTKNSPKQGSVTKPQNLYWQLQLKSILPQADFRKKTISFSVQYTLQNAFLNCWNWSGYEIIVLNFFFYHAFSTAEGFFSSCSKALCCY